MQVDHIGIAVHKLKPAIQLYQNLGLKYLSTEVVESQQVEVAFFNAGHACWELLAPTSNTSPIFKFLTHSASSIHHVAFKVQDIHAELQRLSAQGFRLVHPQPMIGAKGYLVAFVHPQSTAGALLELCQHP